MDLKQNFRLRLFCEKDDKELPILVDKIEKFETRLIYVIRLSEPHPFALFFETAAFKPVALFKRSIPFDV